MSYPIWLTPAGSLGTVPESDYYQFAFDAYDPSGSPLTYTFISGQLPPGLQVTRSGSLQGVPTLNLATEVNRQFEFSVRVKNAQGFVADRTFSMSISNIVPPIIAPAVHYLGDYFDGHFFTLQLYAIEVNPQAVLTWTIESGTLPTGLTLDSTGLITGFIMPLPVQGNAGTTGYSDDPYNEFGYNNSPIYTNNNYTFTVRLSDGVNFTSFTYSMNVTASSSWTADNTINSVNDTSLTVDSNNLYVPIITTPPQSLPPIRSGSFYAFQFQALDPNNDIVNFTLQLADGSGFDPIDYNFDMTKFDQGTTSLPPGLSIDNVTGWLTGHIPKITGATVTYQFDVIAYKQNYPTYVSLPVTFSLTVLGDINNTVTWLTPQNLGQIDNGAISELSVSASSNAGKLLVYSLEGSVSRLPQGLELLPNGLISGRATFEYFSLDVGNTTFDGGATTFDNQYTFSITATTTDGTAYATQAFTVTVNNYNRLPYENLYLQALPSIDQRQLFLSIVNNVDIFPEELIYRSGDSWFGRATAIRSLFMAGINPTYASDYIRSMNTNHFNKRITFSNVKTAQALDANFNVKYEVVYIDLQDLQTDQGRSPADIMDLTYKINPYIDAQGNEYTIYYPNAFQNMRDAINSSVGYAHPGAYPDWMTSPQADGSVLGFTQAVVLAYTKPGASTLIAYRLQTSGLEFNNIEFVADRYLLDNQLSTNYNISLNKFDNGLETTFDRIRRIDTVTHHVNYAVDVPFDQVHNQTITYIDSIGGLDGVFTFNNGDTLIFSTQEGFIGFEDTNDGWIFTSNTGATSIIPGFTANLINPAIQNQRAGVWQVTINIPGPNDPQLPLLAGDFGSDLIGFDTRGYDFETEWLNPQIPTQIITLAPVEGILLNDRVQISQGQTHSSSIMYYNPVLQPGKSVPEFTILPVTPGGGFTTFDNGNTKFISNRDIFATPGQNDKYLKFPKTGVFK
jgi:hypothetical protein